MNRFGILGVLLATFAAAISLGQEADNAQAPPPPPASETDESGDADDSSDVFIPSEEIPADQEVTFPVDI